MCNETVEEKYDNGYDARVDSWSIGVLLYILLSGDVPFSGWNGLKETD